LSGRPVFNILQLEPISATPEENPYLTVAGNSKEIVSRTAFTALAFGVVSLLLFLWHVDHPPQLIYDEGFYVSAARAFLAGQPDPTAEVPPVGKLMVAAGIATFGDNASGWRAMSIAFGALSVVGVFLWTKLLLRDSILALTAGLLTLLNNFVYVMSRVAMMDVFLVGFLLWGLLAFTAAIELSHIGVWTRRVLLLAAGAALGLACAAKWNGIDTLAVVILSVLSLILFGKKSANERISHYHTNLDEVGYASIFASLIVIPVLAYSLTFWPLCHRVHRPFGVHELIAMNVYIWRIHRTIAGNPALDSPWYSWALQVAPQRMLSSLVGNWAVMWGGLVALFFCARRIGKSFAHTFLVLLYAANLLQWAFTPQKHLYYYYYFAASTFLGVAIAVALQGLPQRVWGIRLYLVCVVVAGCVFLFCFPHMAYLEAPFDCALGCWQ
jgi:dolichyl-phosphate-mannose-protein mannosyltransferase